jgi:iron complex outermembrane receptor protein
MTPMRLVALGLWLAALALPHSVLSQGPAADADVRAPRFLLAMAGTGIRKPIDVRRTPSLNGHVALDLDGVSLRQALEEISRQSGLRLAYTDDVLPPGARVRLSASDISVAGALSTVLLDAGLDVVFTRAGEASLVRRDAVAPPGRVVGRVIDQQKNQPIPGAEVLLEGTKWRTLTHEDGRYTLTDVVPRSYTITARRIGYGKQSQPVTVGDGQEVTADFALQPVAATLSEVVVTAQKREERLINTPQSVTVLPADQLAKAGATQFRDFANTVPGLTFTTAGAGFTQVSLRGVTSGSPDVSPTVGIYVDEVPYGSSSAFTNGARLTLDAGLFDLDRIEVLRGPQGTLYGASTMGGLIKYVSKQPNTTRFGVDAQAGTSGTHDGGVSTHGALAVNAPVVTDKVAVRASGFYSRDAGYIDNLALGTEDVNRSDIYGGRLDLRFTPTDALTVRIAGFLQNISRNGEATADFSVAGVPQEGRLAQDRALPEPFDQHFRLVSGTVGYDLGYATLTSISGYQTTGTVFVIDLSPIYAPFLSSYGGPFSAVGLPGDTHTKRFTQEARLSSKESRSLEWVIGGFYNHETTDYVEGFSLRDLAGQPVANTLYALALPSRFEEYAAFGDLTWHLTSKFDVTGGTRYARNHQSFTQSLSGIFGASTEASRSNEDVFTYLANARYHLSDQATAYLRYATGYRPGGPNLSARDPATGLPLAPQTFEADRLESYEAGLKAETADGQLGFDLAGYYIDWNNIQILTLRGGFGVRLNAPGGASIRGGELAFTARPIRDFTTTAALAYQDAKLSEADADLGGAEGERLPNVPRFTASLSSDYRLLVSRLQPSVGATLRHVSDRRAGFDNAVGNPSVPPQFRLPAYTAVDLRAGFAVSSTDLQLYVRNLFDERGELSASTQFGTARTAIVQPRTIGVSVTTAF